MGKKTNSKGREIPQRCEGKEAGALEDGLQKLPATTGLPAFYPSEDQHCCDSLFFSSLQLILAGARQLSSSVCTWALLAGGQTLKPCPFQALMLEWVERLQETQEAGIP